MLCSEYLLQRGLDVKLLPLHKTQCETVAICRFLFVGQILLAAAASSHSIKPFHSNFHQCDVLHQHYKIIRRRSILIYVVRVALDEMLLPPS